MEQDRSYQYDSSPTRHTQFLDLTNGEGGERHGRNNSNNSGSSTNSDHHHNGYDDDDDDVHMDHHRNGSGSGGGSRSASTSIARGAPTSSRLSLAGGGGRFDPNTPGKVVETGQEHTGRWTKEEHEAFLSALNMYGKEWKKVAAKVKTRTVVQTRTHAQKYFQKIAKAQETGKGGGSDSDVVPHVEMGVASESRRHGSGSSSYQKKKRIAAAARAAAAAAAAAVAESGPAPKAQRTASVASAAHVISNLSTNPSAASGVGAAPAATAATSDQVYHHHLASSASGVSAAAVAAMGLVKAQLPAGRGRGSASALFPSHGFSTYGSNAAQPPSDSAYASSYAPSTTAVGGNPYLPATATTSKPSAFAMKIVAPEHDAASKRGKFPEPSPAACGKRKLAEIAAARMLAGVAASGAPPSELFNPQLGPVGVSSGAGGSAIVGRGGSSTSSMTNTVLSGGGGVTGQTMSTTTQPMVTSSLDVGEDGTATPPPEEEGGQEPAVPSRDLPAPPSLSNNHQSDRKPGLGLSLQIVNPESLGVSYEQQQKRRRDGQGSPQTPWEGQLQALVSEEKRKGPPKAGDLDLPTPPDMDGFGASSSPHKVCGPGSAYGRNPLHKAVCEMDLAVIQGEIQSLPPEFFQRKDKAGFCPMHSACSLCMKDDKNSKIATEIVRMLVTSGADTSVQDSEGNTPLHWAARAGDKGTAEFLLLKHSPIDARNERGETPLHWALRAGRVGMEVAAVLLENGSRPSVWSLDFKRPIDVAADGYHDEEMSIMDLKKLISQRKRLSKEQRRLIKDAAEHRKDARANFLQNSIQSRTLVLHHPECLQHIPKAASDWENPGRVTSILDRLLGDSNNNNAKNTQRTIHDHEISVSQEFEKATLDLLSRVHSTEYLNFVNELSKDLERQQKEMDGEQSSEEEANSIKPPVVPFTPMVQRSMIKVAESSVKLGQHSDTSFSVGSLRAARRAAGAVQHAVDCVLIGRHRNAFCVVRPPGHHAGINGLLDGGESCGFCIFNSVAAGAMHAISDERLLCERCAIVDIDVHHGNGTEEIVRKCHDPGKLFFFSIHLFDNERKGKRETKSFQYKFYPGTGDEDDVALNIINVPIAPLWKEKEQSAPTVVTHNTRHRARQRVQDKDDDSEAGTSPKASDVEIDSSSRSLNSGTSSPVTAKSSAHGTFGRIAYRRAIQNRLLPALRAFNPDLILISAGFDACKGDVGNAKHEYAGKERMGLDLEPEDYAWTTRKIMEIADICCQGRVVSVLEGGYGKTPSEDKNVDVSTLPLDKSQFSECAVRHVHAMIDPYDAEARFRSTID